MAKHGWVDAPQTVQVQVEYLVNELVSLLDSTLIGIYLHGSLAMGCFNPVTSDIDLLVVTSGNMSHATKRGVVETLLQVSNNPHPVEADFLSESNLYPWEYPTPYDLHYGEDRRVSFTNDLASGAWLQWNSQSAWAGDLAAHIAVAQLRGVCLYGEPMALALPLVPASHYADSIVADLWSLRDRVTQKPGQYGMAFILNACRVYAYLLEGYIMNKSEGANWALEILPDEFKALVQQTLLTYEGNAIVVPLDMPLLRRFVDHIQTQIHVFVG